MKSSTAARSKPVPKKGQPPVANKKVLVTKVVKTQPEYKATKVPPKVKLLKRTLGGLIFKTKVMPEQTIVGVRAWVDAGAPDNVYVYDNCDQLTMAGIPIVDATILRGLYIRKIRGKPQPCTVNSRFAVPASEPVVKKTVDGIFDANTKDHHRLAYS